jgi:hypothetical protein
MENKKSVKIKYEINKKFSGKKIQSLYCIDSSKYIESDCNKKYQNTAKTCENSIKLNRDEINSKSISDNNQDHNILGVTSINDISTKSSNESDNSMIVSTNSSNKKKESINVDFYEYQNPSSEQDISIDISFCELKTKSISDKDFAIFSKENDTNIALKTFSKNNDEIRRGSYIYNDFMGDNDIHEKTDTREYTVEFKDNQPIIYNKNSNDTILSRTSSYEKKLKNFKFGETISENSIHIADPENQPESIPKSQNNIEKVKNSKCCGCIIS